MQPLLDEKKQVANHRVDYSPGTSGVIVATASAMAGLS